MCDNGFELKETAKNAKGDGMTDKNFFNALIKWIDDYTDEKISLIKAAKKVDIQNGTLTECSQSIAESASGNILITPECRRPR